MLGAKLPKNVVIYTSLNEAQSETGYFSISTMMITPELSSRVSEFIRKERLETFSQINKKKTADCTYTLNFTLQRYLDGSKSYLSGRGAVGYYKHTLKITRSRINPGHDSECVFVHHPSDEAIEKYEALVARTPTLMDMYFWICQKYPRHLLWMDYSTRKLEGFGGFGNRHN